MCSRLWRPPSAREATGRSPGGDGRSSSASPSRGTQVDHGSSSGGSGLDVADQTSRHATVSIRPVGPWTRSPRDRAGLRTAAFRAPSRSSWKPRRAIRRHNRPPVRPVDARQDVPDDRGRVRRNPRPRTTPRARRPRAGRHGTSRGSPTVSVERSPLRRRRPAVGFLRRFDVKVKIGGADVDAKSWSLFSALLASLQTEVARSAAAVLHRSDASKPHASWRSHHGSATRF